MAKGWSWSLGVPVVAALAFLAAPALAQGQGVSLAVSAPEQAARDDDRMRILRAELAQESRALEDQTKRKAERLAANDRGGVQESEQAVARHTENIAALRREIDQASQPGRARSAPATATRRAPVTASTVVAGAANAPWWDVYGRRSAAKGPAAVDVSDESDRQRASSAAPVR